MAILRNKIKTDLEKLTAQVREIGNQTYFGYGADLDFKPILIYTFREDGTLDNVEDPIEMRYFDHKGELISIKKTWRDC